MGHFPDVTLFPLTYGWFNKKTVEELEMYNKFVPDQMRFRDHSFDVFHISFSRSRGSKSISMNL